jgi:hypothetical protein
MQAHLPASAHNSRLGDRLCENATAAQLARYTFGNASTATERTVCASPELVDRKDMVVATYCGFLLRL